LVSSSSQSAPNSSHVPARIINRQTQRKCALQQPPKENTRKKIEKPAGAILGAFGDVVDWDLKLLKSIKVLQYLTDYASFKLPQQVALRVLVKKYLKLGLCLSLQDDDKVRIVREKV